jgi:hypothetical protein
MSNAPVVMSATHHVEAFRRGGEIEYARADSPPSQETGCGSQRVMPDSVHGMMKRDQRGFFAIAFTRPPPPFMDL